jgi:TP901 family phage tail tape measure protein
VAGSNVAADLMVHVGADTKDATTGLNNVGQKVGSSQKMFQKAAFGLGGMSLGIVGFLGSATMAAASFEQGMANVSAVADLAGDDFQNLSDLALQIGADTSFSATEGAQAIEELVKAGVSVEDVLSGAATSAALLAEAGGVSIPTAAAVMSNALNMFSMSGEQSIEVADAFAAAANASASDVDSLAQALAQVGPSAAGLGMDLEDTLAALALLSNRGVQGSDAGTSLKTMFAALASPTNEAAAAMAKYNIDAFDAQGNFIGMTELAGQLQAGLGDLSPELRSAALQTIFGSDAQRVANILTEEGAEGMGKMQTEVEKTGVANAMAEKRMNTLKGAIEQLKGSVETAMILFGSAFVPVLHKAAEALTGLVNWISNVPAPLQKFIGIAAAAVAGVLGLGAAFSALAGFLAPAIAGVMALLSPIVLVVAAVVGLYLAWKKNLFGIQDATRSVTKPIIDFFSQLVSYFKEVSSGSKVMTESLTKFPKSLQGIISILGAAVDGITEFIKIISGGGGLNEAWKEAIDTFKTPQIQQALANLPKDIANIIKDIPWSDIGSTLWNGFKTGLSYLGQAASWLWDKLSGLASTLWAWVKSLPWGAIGSAIWNAFKSALGYLGQAGSWVVEKLGDLGSRLWDWFSDAVGSVNWRNLFSSAFDVLKNASSWVVDKLGNLGRKLWKWATDAFDAVPWGSIANWVSDQTVAIVQKLGPLGTRLIGWVSSAAAAVPWESIANSAHNIVSNVVSNLGDLIMGLKNWYDNAINSVNWEGLGVTVGTAVRSAISTVVPAIVGYLQENWKTIGLTLLALIVAMPATLGYLGLTLLPKAGEFMQGFLTGLTGMEWSEITAWLGNLPLQLLGLVPALGNVLLKHGNDLVVGLWNGILQIWPSLIAWLGTIGTLAVGAVGNLLETLKSRGIQLLAGLIAGAISVWMVTIVPWLASIPGKAYTAVTDLSTAIKERGVQLLAGLAKGATSVWNDTIVPWLGSLGSSAATKVGTLSGALWNAGWSLIQGFWMGISSKANEMYNDVKGIVDKIIGLFSDIPGHSPIRHVGQFYGAELGSGFGQGIAATEDFNVDKTAGLIDAVLSGFSRNLAGEVAANMTSGGTGARMASVDGTGTGKTTIQYIQIDAKFDDVPEMVRAAEFVSKVNTAREMYTDTLPG